MSSITQLPLTAVTADSIKQELIDRIKVYFPDWSDQQDSNNMIMLIEQLAAYFELQYAYLNRMAREAFIQYALDPRNVEAHARGLGYIPRYQTPSQVQARIVSATPASASTVIPAGTKFNTQGAGVNYETDTDVTLLQDQTATDLVVLKQQESWSDSYTGTGQANQQVKLNYSPVMPDTISVEVDGVEWTFVENFIEQTATSMVYTWMMNPDSSVSVIFGNGVSGKIVAIDAAVSIAYKTGGGKAGSIGIGQLGTCLSEVRDSGNGTLLSLTGVNTVAATPGSDKETIDQIRKHAIANLRAPKVLLNLDDVEAYVSSLEGVQLCKAANWQTMPTLPRYIASVFVVPIGGGQPSTVLKDYILTCLKDIKPLVMGMQPMVMGPTYVTLNFSIKLVVKGGYAAVSVKNAITQTLVDLFSPASTPIQQAWGFTPDFGQAIYMSQLIAILQQIPGVAGVDIMTPLDTTLAMNEFPVVGTVTFA